MCQHCTEKITTGKQYSEYIVTPELHDEHSDDETALVREFCEKYWKEAPTVENGLKVFIINKLRVAAGLCPLKKTDKTEGSALVNPYYAVAFSESSRQTTKKLHELYFSDLVSLDSLFRIRHPLRDEVPYFRQIQLGKGYILVSNTFAAWDAGVIKIYGTPERLAEVVGRMVVIHIKKKDGWEQDAKDKAGTCHYTIRNNEHFGTLLTSKGIIKIMDSYLFVVNKTDRKKEMEFSFTDRFDDVVKLVYTQLAKEINESKR